jgi:hypothetical protein
MQSGILSKMLNDTLMPHQTADLPNGRITKILLSMHTQGTQTSSKKTQNGIWQDCKTNPSYVLHEELPKLSSFFFQ